MLASRPAAGPAHAFFQLFLGSADAALSGLVLLGILDPADEFVTRQGRDVVPRGKCGGVRDQRLAQVGGQFVHHPTGHSLAAHGASLTCAMSRDLSQRRNTIKLTDMRDRETIDSELRLLAATRRSIREQGRQPSCRKADELLDELLAHDAGTSLTTPVEPDVVADTRSRGDTAGGTPRKRKDVLRRRMGLFAALPLSLIAVASAVVVILASHHQDSSAQAPETPPSVAPPKPVAPKAPPPRIDVVDMAFIGA